jgi:hypothetical protein
VRHTPICEEGFVGAANADITLVTARPASPKEINVFPVLHRPSTATQATCAVVKTDQLRLLYGEFVAFLDRGEPDADVVVQHQRPAQEARPRVQASPSVVSASPKA